MKVCQVVADLRVGGTAENAVLCCEGLHACGHEATLIAGRTLPREPYLLARAQAGGYRVVLVESMRPGRRGYRPVLDCLRDLHPDIVHSHGYEAGVVVCRAGERLGDVRIVHTLHGMPVCSGRSWLAGRLRVARRRRAARGSDALVAVADAVAAEALKLGIGQPEQYTTIRSGLEVEAFLDPSPAAAELRSAMNLSAKAVLVTQVSRLEPGKGHEHLLAAAERVTDERVHFCLVGSGRLRREIEAEISRLSLTRRFRLTGLIDPGRIPAVMQASDIVVHASLCEGLARPVPQAMLAARPVVAFDVGGTREVLDSAAGILLEPKDVAGLALAIETLADSAALRRRLGQAGRQKARALFDHRVMIDRIEQLYGGLSK